MKNGALCALVDAKMTNNGYKTLGALGTVILLKWAKFNLFTPVYVYFGK
jgi:hypothetical protein